VDAGAHSSPVWNCSQEVSIEVADGNGTRQHTGTIWRREIVYLACDRAKSKSAVVLSWQSFDALLFPVVEVFCGKSLARNQSQYRTTTAAVTTEKYRKLT
jgi:hypothetical protein